MLHGAVLRAKYPRALVKKIDVAAAQALPGVEVVLTAKDVPGERLLGHVVYDWPVMIAEGEETRYVGDALAVLAATTKETARQAVELIRGRLRRARAAAVARSGAGRGCAEPAPQGKCAVHNGAEARRRGAGHRRGEARGNAALLDAAPGTCISGAGERAGRAYAMRIADRVYRRSERLRRSSRDCAHAGRCRRKGARHQQVCGRRIRRQRRYVGAAPRGAAGLAQRASR